MRLAIALMCSAMLMACTGGSGPRSEKAPETTPTTGVSVSGYARSGVVWEG